MDSTKTLAEGCFGKVYMQKYGDKWAALKKVPVDRISLKEVIREYQVYETAKHNNVVKLLGDPWLEDEKLHVPLEFVFGEDLETTIFNRPKSKIQLRQSVKSIIITGMCEGLNFLHSKDIVHQDLKPDNIMIEHGSHRAVIIDMGLAKFFKNGLNSAENRGNWAYSAPEIRNGNDRDKRSDVWAMGKIIAVLCLKLPTHDLTPYMIKDSLKGSPYCSVVSRMVEPNAAERATMAGVIGEIQQIEANCQKKIQSRTQRENQEAGAQRSNTGLDMRLDVTGTAAANLGAKEVKCLVPFTPAALANQFSQFSLSRFLPEDGTMVHQRFDGDTGELEFNQLVMRKGKVVKYEGVKSSK